MQNKTPQIKKKKLHLLNFDIPSNQKELFFYGQVTSPSKKGGYLSIYRKDVGGEGKCPDWGGICGWPLTEFMSSFTSMIQVHCWQNRYLWAIPLQNVDFPHLHPILWRWLVSWKLFLKIYVFILSTLCDIICLELQFFSRLLFFPKI